jgi:hypothetical protein
MAEEMKFYETACKEGDEEVSSSPMVYTRLQILRSCINTLEVKEVDLEKEIEEHAICMPMSEFTHDSEAEDFYEWAREEFRYFFELGLKAQKGE